MKGTNVLHLHPENLRGGVEYKVTFKGFVNTDIEVIQCGTFKGLTLIPFHDRTILGAKFLFFGEGLPKIIPWFKIIKVERVFPKNKKDKPNA